MNVQTSAQVKRRGVLGRDLPCAVPPRLVPDGVRRVPCVAIGVHDALIIFIRGLTQQRFWRFAGFSFQFARVGPSRLSPIEGAQLASPVRAPYATAM